MALPYGPPQSVSPLIRGVRFALLVAGIIYARSKQMLYSSMEASYREEEAKKKVIRDRELVILKSKIAAEEKEVVRLLQTGELFDIMAGKIPAPPPGGAGPSGDGKKCN